MEQDLISIIVPVYNVEEYLERCINSILEQTYKKIEVILINDGSIDFSGEICDEYTKKDERIVVIHQKNEGQASARNKGIEKASGKYLCFLDSDDFIEKDFVEYLYKIVLETGCEVAYCGIRHIGFPGRKEEQEIKESINTYEGKQAAYFTLCGKQGFSASICRGMYCKKIFDNIRFMPGRLYEDLEIAVRLDLKAKNCVIGRKRNYCYCYRPNNSSSTPIKIKIQDFNAVMVSIYQMFLGSSVYSELLEAAYARDMMNSLFIMSGEIGRLKESKEELQYLRHRILSLPQGLNLQTPLYRIYYYAVKIGIIPFSVVYKILNIVRAIAIKFGF